MYFMTVVDQQNKVISKLISFECTPWLSQVDRDISTFEFMEFIEFAGILVDQSKPWV